MKVDPNLKKENRSNNVFQRFSCLSFHIDKNTNIIPTDAGKARNSRGRLLNYTRNWNTYNHKKAIYKKNLSQCKKTCVIWLMIPNKLNRSNPGKWKSRASAVNWQQHQRHRTSGAKPSIDNRRCKIVFLNARKLIKANWSLLKGVVFGWIGWTSQRVIRFDLSDFSIHLRYTSTHAE